MRIPLSKVIADTALVYAETIAFKTGDLTAAQGLIDIAGKPVQVITIKKGELARIYRKYRPAATTSPNATVYRDGATFAILVDEDGDASIAKEIGKDNAIRFLALHEFTHILFRDMPSDMVTDANGCVEEGDLDPERNNSFADGYAAERLAHELRARSGTCARQAERVLEISEHYAWKGPSSSDFQAKYPYLKDHSKAW